MIGRTYLERGQPVVVLTRWGDIRRRPTSIPFGILDLRSGLRDAPRNVLIRRQDGSAVVRPFRGLRKLPEAAKSAPPLNRSETDGGRGAP